MVNFRKAPQPFFGGESNPEEKAARYTRLLAKLAIEITDTAYEIEPQSEAFSAIAISIGNNFKAFDEANHMLVENTAAGNCAIAPLVIFA